MTMQIAKQREGVWMAESSVVAVDRELVATLVTDCGATAAGRTRLCVHGEATDAVHEMLIVLDARTYVRPHRHHGKSESYHVIQGRGRVVLFDETGAVARVVLLGDYGSGRSFFFRLSEPSFHTLLVDTPRLILHETTGGPFVPGDAEVAPWAPAADAEPAIIKAYLATLRRGLDDEEQS
jgi:cupin fold WbuC family metalloprotein